MDRVDKYTDVVYFKLVCGGRDLGFFFLDGAKDVGDCGVLVKGTVMVVKDQQSFLGLVDDLLPTFLFPDFIVKQILLTFQLINYRH